MWFAKEPYAGMSHDDDPWYKKENENSAEKDNEINSHISSEGNRKYMKEIG